MPQFLVELEDGRKLNVESDIEPTDDDINDFLNQGAPPAASPVSSPSDTFLGQSFQKLRTGTQQAIAGAKTTLSALGGFDQSTGQGLSDLAASARQSQDERTPQDIAFQDQMQQNAAEFDAAPGIMGKAREFVDFAGIAARNPRAAFQMGLQSVPNALISIPAAAAGKAIGAATGLAAGIESGPGAIATGAAGMALGAVGSNILMEGGGAIADKISQATNGQSANWTPEQFTSFIQANPEIVKSGLKSGAVRGSIIGAVDAASMGLAGRVLKPAMGTVGRAGMAARGAAATGIEMASEGAGEALAGFVDTGRVDSQASFQEMMGGPVTAIPSALVGRSLSALRPTPETLAPVADPLAAYAATLPVPPSPSPPVTESTAPTQTWNVELDDGRKFIVESDTEPTVADIEDYLATAATPATAPAAPAPAAAPVPTEATPAPATDALISNEPSSASVTQGPERAMGDNTVPNAIDAGSIPATGASLPVSPSPSPQVSGSSSLPLATRKVPVIEDAPYGGQDILDFVNDSPIVIPETARGGDMDWAERAGLPKAYAKFLAIPGDVSNINEVAQDAYDANLIDDTTPDALMAKIQEVITSRENAKADAKSQQSQMNEAEKARILFDKAVARAAKAKTGTQRIEIDAMNKGDTLTLGGETMTVVAQDVNEDGFNTSVTLRSESGRLGTVTLTADTPALAVETYTPKAPETSEASGNSSTWADSVIAASMETPFIGIDPRLMAAYTVKGAQLIREGFTTFAKWSAEMIRRFGEAVRDYLQDVWQSAVQNSQLGRLDILPGKTQKTGKKQVSGVSSVNGESWIIQGLTEAPLDVGAAGRLVSRESSQPDAYANPGRPIPDYYGSRASIQDIVGEEQKLIQRAQTEGFFWQPDQVQRVLKQVRKRAGGGEHDVFLHGTKTTPLVLRSTINDSYGLQGRSPAQYLKRVEDYNATFPALQMRVIGVSKNTRGNGVVWTAQPFVEGREFKEDSDLQRAMEKAGWKRISSDTTYEHTTTGAVIQDVHTGNVLTDGTDLYPIDVVVLKRPNTGFKSPDTAPDSGNAGTWADSVIADSMETPFIGIDPRLMAAYTIKGAQLIREGFTTFAQWSAEMLRRFGEAVRNYLQDVWRLSEGGFVGTGGSPLNSQPSTPNSQPNTAPVSLAQADVAAEREAAGKSALPTGNQFTVAALEEAARAEVQIPGRVAALMADLKETLRATEPLETYILLNYKGALEAELSEVEPILSDPGTDPNARTAAAQRKLEADAKLDDLELISQLSRSKAGATLGAMSRPLSRDSIPSLHKMVADITLIMDPTGRTPLPPEERAKIEELHTTIIETKAAADKQEEEGVAGAKNTYNLELEKLLKEAQDLIKQQEEELAIQKRVIENKANPVKLKTKNKGLLKKWADEGDMALERLRASGLFKQANAGIGLTPSQILDAAQLIRGVLSKGIIASADAAAILVQKLGAAAFPVFERFMPQIIDKVNTLQDDDIKDLRPDKDDIKAKAKKIVLAGGKVPPTLARQFALAHIIDHLNRKDNTLSAEKIAKLVADDLQEFFPGIKERQARDLISGYGKSSKPSKEEARVQLRDLSAQMQKLTQLEALMNKERLLKSGAQRQEPSARLRELQKQVEQLKKDTGYQSRSQEDELRSIRDRIQKTLENQIEELQRVLAGQAAPTAPRQRQVYDANLQALQTLRNSLKVLVAELPQHRLASELRRNVAAEAAARASEREYNRRIQAKEWKAEGKAQGPQTQAVTAARAAAAAARQQFLDLKRAAQPSFDPNVRELAAYKKRIQAQITKLNERMAKGEFDPPKRTPRQIKHDEQSAKLLTDLNKAKRAFIDAKVAAKFAKMGLFEKGIEKLRTFVFTARSLMAGGEFSGIGRQGLLKALSHPVRFIGDLKAMKQAFKSEAGETAMFQELYARPNAINGRYKRAKLALHNPEDYSDLLAEGAARSKLANTLPWFSHTGRAYTALLSHMRADLFDSLVAKYEKRTKAEISDTAAAAIAEFVNDSTGSGKLGIGKIELRGNQKDLASLILFSPSFLASRLRVLTGASLLGGNMQTRAIIAEEYIRIMAGYAALFALAAALQGDDEEEMELDPRGGGFLKMQFGATSVDLMAGLNSMATFLTRTITGETKTKDGIKAIRGEDADMGQSWIDIAQRFARGKLSPVAGFAVNRLTGTDALGRKETALQGVQRMVTPITFGAAWDIGMEEPANRSAALIPAAFLGVGTNTTRPKNASFFGDLGRITGFKP
jgi:hypothetical protein